MQEAARRPAGRWGRCGGWGGNARHFKLDALDVDQVHAWIVAARRRAMRGARKRRVTTRASLATTVGICWYSLLFARLPFTARGEPLHEPVPGFLLARRGVLPAPTGRVAVGTAAALDGAAVKRKEDTHRMAEANRAFAHFKA